MRNRWMYLLWAPPLVLFSQAATPLLSEPGPTFRIANDPLPGPLTIISYGDQRFTDPANVRATNPRVRRWLVEQIAAEHPAAVIMNGDVPLSGDVVNDYRVFESETKPWRDAHLRVFPTLGNHELHGKLQQALEHWWSAFPEMRNRRWYSAQFGARVYLLALDSAMPLLPESEQARWIDAQIKALPPSIELVIVALHHPPVADIQQHIEVSHNPRPNEIALRDYLSKAVKNSNAAFLVVAGHIHNYERSAYEGVTYLVSGGGGAVPYYVERTPEDQYKSILFPNYHYVKLRIEDGQIRGEMYRIADPEAETLRLDLKDTFSLSGLTEAGHKR